MKLLPAHLRNLDDNLGIKPGGAVTISGSLREGLFTVDTCSRIGPARRAPDKAPSTMSVRPLLHSHLEGTSGGSKDGGHSPSTIELRRTDYARPPFRRGDGCCW